GTVCVVGKMRDLILQLSKSSIYSTKPAAVKKIRVSDDRLSRLLYTDDDEESEMRQSSQIKDTDRPLALKSCTTDFIRQFHYFMNKNSHLKQMKVSDVMKLSD
ncbi:DUF6387 family protein, partial [Klebsiella pneumoniae]